MKEELAGKLTVGTTQQEAWERLATPQVKAQIAKETISLAISLSATFQLSPEEVGELLATLDQGTAEAISWGFSNVGDAETLRMVGRALMKPNKSSVVE